MVTRRNLVLVALITCFLTITVFRVLPIFSSSTPGYDPWLDINDDGKIDGRDLIVMSRAFATYGDPINKTELLIEVNNTYTQLLNTINSCNASLIDLQGRVTALESITLPLNDTILTLQSRIDTLNASLLDIVSRTNSLNTSVIDIQFRTTLLEGEVAPLQNNVTMLQANIASLNTTVTLLWTAVTTLQSNFDFMNASLTTLQSTVNDLIGRVSALEANYSYAIPSNSSYTYNYAATSDAYNWIDMPYMSVTLAVNRTSNLLILFSTDAYCTTGQIENTYIYIQAMVNSSYAYPTSVTLTPAVQVTGSPVLSPHSHYLSNGAYSYNFNMPSVTPGSYTIKIQWHVSYASTQGTAYVGYRTLTVIALPS
jgi:uncharacterized coiled-coil protein SlyX